MAEPLNKTQVQVQHTDYIGFSPLYRWTDVVLTGDWRCTCVSGRDCYLEFQAWGGVWHHEDELRIVVTTTNSCHGV